MTESPPVQPRHGDVWTIEDLFDLPDGYRYEILDGSLLVTPPPDKHHGYATQELTNLLVRHTPPDLYPAGAGLGVTIRAGSTYLVPDIVVVHRSIFATPGMAVEPADVLLVVEVSSPNNARRDRVMKRQEYADAGIPLYWIVDRKTQTMTVLKLRKATKEYVEAAVVKPGERWHTDEPFPLAFDLAEVL